MIKEVQRLATDHPELSINDYDIERHNAYGAKYGARYNLTSSELVRQMSESLLCPIPQGDLPFQHRFFDALVTGCVPLVISYHGEECDIWSYDLSHRKYPQKGGWPTPCAKSSYPFQSLINYTDITVQIDSEDFTEDHFAEALLRLDRSEIEEKRAKVEQLRTHFVYDWTGATFDAFSSLLSEVCGVMSARDTVGAA